VGGVGPDFRWRAWMGTHRELKREMNQRGQMNELDMLGIEAAEPLIGEVSAYSVRLRPGSLLPCCNCAYKTVITWWLMSSMSTKVGKAQDEMPECRKALQRCLLRDLLRTVGL
jgi:hypothetical protein